MPKAAPSKEIAEAVELLKKGDLVALPTETVYAWVRTRPMKPQWRKYLQLKAAPRITP